MLLSGCKLLEHMGREGGVRLNSVDQNGSRALSRERRQVV
jgi:hypothetical protein